MLDTCFQSKRPVLVCGLGQSGVSACRLLRRMRMDVVAVDEGTAPTVVQNADVVRAIGCEAHVGVLALPAGDFGCAIVSPGLPLASPLLRACAERDIPLVSELELGWHRHKGATLAVTGSNGKSSVVKWLVDSMIHEGFSAVACGNYGLPVCQAVLDVPDADWLVMEVSSFQLETCHAFRPDVGVLLNILPNHLDRHGDMANYTALKARLFAHQQEGDAAIIPEALKNVILPLAASNPDVLWMGFADNTHCGDISGTYFDNPVLRPHASAGFQALYAAGVSMKSGEWAARQFIPLPHRSQKVGEAAGVTFVDDSKATNLAAMMAALRINAGPIRLIAGGRAKESDFSAAADLLKSRVLKVYLIGEAADAMYAAWHDAVPCEPCGTLDAAVQAAMREARACETILLSPACTSYDQFENYQKRGLCFQALVAQR